MISKEKVLSHFETVEAVAEFFDISVQAVYQWPDEAIPRERELELLLKVPGVFGAADQESPQRRQSDPHVGGGR